MSKIRFYLAIIDYFFDTDLRFRIIGVDKSKIKVSEFGNEYDEFYYKMYYQLLHYRINTMYHYNVYLDIKDNLSASKVRKLRDILNVRFGVFRNVQNINSSESVLMQLADFIMGAISYNANDELKLNRAKCLILEKIKRHLNDIDLMSTNYSKKLNLFFIDLK